MDVTAVNRGERESSIGFRFLIDTKLGEKSGVHLGTDRRTITGRPYYDRLRTATLVV